MELKIFGSVLTVLEGKTTPETLRPVESGNFRFALGASTFSDVHGVGETIIIEGVPHASWVKEGKLLTQDGLGAKSPFLVGIEKSETSNLLFQQTSPIVLGKLYEELSLKYPMGFALLGSFRMARFVSTYLKKPPIYGENVNERKGEYWANVQYDSGVFVDLFGVVIPPKAKEEGKRKKWFPLAFYDNPGETVAWPFASHTHSAIVDHPADPEMKDLKRVKKVLGVRHTLTESLIQRGSYLLFPIGDVKSE